MIGGMKASTYVSRSQFVFRTNVSSADPIYILVYKVIKVIHTNEWL